MITPELIVSLLLIMCVAWILGTLFTRFGLPAMLGELLAGVILGPPILVLVSPSTEIQLKDCATAVCKALWRNFEETFASVVRKASMVAILG